MAKYILLSFDDNEKAEGFITACQETGITAQVRHEPENPEHGSALLWEHFTPDVRAVYQMPTKFCTCLGGKKTFTRGKKYGWWVHADCGKPTQAWATGSHWFQALGRNLLPKTPQAPEYRGDGNWGIPRADQ
jgi:hypothetical protein